MSCGPWLCQPITQGLLFLYHLLGGNLGWAIIFLTVAIRLVLTPLTLPSLKSAQKIRALQPELDKLKQKYGADKQEFARRQIEFYKQKGVNPAAGCLPQIIQIIVLIGLFQAFQSTLVNGDGLNTRFAYLDLTQPDLVPIPAVSLFGFTLNRIPGIFLILAAATQFFSSKLMLPTAAKGKQLAEKTKEQSDDMAAAMQQQMLYLMPLMTLFIGFKFASGLVLYWLTFSLVMLVQQLALNYGKKTA